MATTYELIASNTLTSSASSVTFSGIPNTFTDLVVRFSARSDRSSYLEYFNLSSNLGAGYSSTALYGTATSSLSSNESSATTMFGAAAAINGNTSTASTFSTSELYIPSYTVSQSKTFSVFTVLENNNTSSWRIVVAAGLKQNNAALSSITLTPTYGPNFVSDSSFFLYGIKNS